MTPSKHILNRLLSKSPQPLPEVLPGLGSDPDDVNVIAAARTNAETGVREYYVFLYKPGRTAELLTTLGRFAASPELSFTWYDAAVMARRIRGEQYPQQKPDP
jgi:hypothetical protein